MFSDLYHAFTSGPFHTTVVIIGKLYPVWLPIILGLIFWDVWIRYVRAVFMSKTDHVLLEIKLPREITKSPLAMELVLNTLFQTGRETTFIDRWWEGKVRPWFSLELVSLEGKVHFYIWTETGLKNLVESQLYSQFPGIEIFETEDYTLPLSFNPDINEISAFELKLEKSDTYPIKTYVDYGQDENPDEEEEVDPLTSVLEFLGSLKKDEQAWIQIVIRAHKGDWKDRIKKEIKEIVKNAAEKSEEEKAPKFTNLSKGQQDLIKNMERVSSKYAFDTGIRVLYYAPKDIFNKLNTGGITGTIRQFNSNYSNGFKTDKGTGFDYPWQDFMNIRVNKMKKKFLTAYKKRQFFYKPHKASNFVLTTEELVTLYHFPGSVAQTPSLERVPSKKSVPPPNLPM